MGNSNFVKVLSAATVVVVGLAAVKVVMNRSLSQAPQRDTPGPVVKRSEPEAPVLRYTEVSEASLDPQVQAVVQGYVDRLAGTGLERDRQGVWVQSGDRLLAQHEGKTRMPAASLTKLATTLLALEKWDPDYKFITRIGVAGTVENGVLNGDLVFFGGADPMFVWESAVAVGNSLNQLGIREVTGNLIVSDIFVMNFERDRDYAAELLRQGLDSDSWGWEASAQFDKLPEGTMRPTLKINGEAVVMDGLDKSSLSIVAEHHSFKLQELLKRMNMYSNNIMAELLADLMGGAPALEKGVVALTGVGPEEVQFINGSGLGQENQLSPRASCRMLDVMGNQLKPHSLGLKDVLPIVPIDQGTLQDRDLPQGLIGKTGTLATVSNLAGVLPLGTEPALSLEQPDSVCFSIQNYGSDLNYFYQQQEVVIAALNSAKPVSQPASGTESDPTSGTDDVSQIPSNQLSSNQVPSQ